MDDPPQRPDPRHPKGGTVLFLDGAVNKYRPYPNTRPDNERERQENSHLWRRNNQTKP
jgi:prepilin-type processing-associated H-X9-DG protein